MAFGALEIQGQFFEQHMQKSCHRGGGGCCLPDLTNIGAGCLQALELLGAGRTGALLFATAQFCFCGCQLAQMIFPFGFQSASYPTPEMSPNTGWKLRLSLLIC